MSPQKQICKFAMIIVKTQTFPREGTQPRALETQLPLNTVRSVTLRARRLWLGFEDLAEEQRL